MPEEVFVAEGVSASEKVFAPAELSAPVGVYEHVLSKQQRLEYGQLCRPTEQKTIRTRPQEDREDFLVMNSRFDGHYAGPTALELGSIEHQHFHLMHSWIG